MPRSALPGQMMVSQDGSRVSTADHPRSTNVDEDDRHVANDREPAGEGNGVSHIRDRRRFSYTDFDVACWTSAVASKLPIAPVNSFDQSSRPSSSSGLRPPFRLHLIQASESLIPLASNDAEAASLKDSVFAEANSNGGRLSNNSLMYREEYRMPIVSSKDPPYKHLQTSSSVESNDTPPFEKGGSPAAANNRLTANRHSAGANRAGSTSTMTTTATDRHRRPRSPRIHPIHHERSQDVNRQSSNDDENSDPASNVPYHPHSPQSNSKQKPMIFERGPSRTGSANMLKVPETITVGGAAIVIGSLMKENSLLELKQQNNEKADDGSAPQANNHANGLASIPRHSNNTSGHRHVNVTQTPSKPGCFMNDDRRQVDFILVYERGQSTTMDRQRRYFENNLQQEGLILESDSAEADESNNNKFCFVRVHVPWNTLCRSAEILQMKMPLRNAELPDLDRLTTLGPPGVIGSLNDFFCSNWFDFNDTEKILIGRGSKNVTACFTRNRMDKFLINDSDSFFTSTQRIRIVYEIMQKAKCDPDDTKKRGVQWLLKNGAYSGAYPPHDGEPVTRNLNTNEPSKWSQRQILKHTWASFNRLFKPQPLNLIRAYFGEKIGFYFAWLGFYTQMLVFPSIVGVICFLSGFFSLSSNPLVLEMCSEDHLHEELANLTMCPVCQLPNCRPWKLHDGCESAHWNYGFDNESQVIMAIFTLLWATVFMELWKRKEAELAAEWDAYDAEQGDEPTRPEYEARTKSVRISPVTNEEEAYISPYRRAWWLTLSATGVSLLILTVVLALMALIAVRIAIYLMLYKWNGLWEDYKFEIASLIIHVFTFAIVMTLGSIYEPTAHRLTELECPRTQADYLSSYIWKVFSFEILNNFVPIFYAALIRGHGSLPKEQNYLTEMCDPGGCLNEVVQAIAILLLARLLISNAAELGIPFLKSLLKSKGLNGTVHPDHDDDHDHTVRKIPLWQRDFALNEPDLDGVYAEYLEMMVQFGYVTLFISAFPLAPLICLLNNIVEIRLDATNFVTSFRRPLPARVSGLRIWRRCLNIIIKLSVVCNGAFLAFTSELVPTMIYRYAVSDDYSTKGYMNWTMARMNTDNWPEFREAEPDADGCWYRDFRHDNKDHDRKLIWWQIMVARLAFFVIFVITFYFIQWLCDFLVPDVPKNVKLKIDRSNFLARQTLYNQESGSSSAGSRPRNHSGFVRTPGLSARRPTEGTVSTTAPLVDPDYNQQKQNIANGHAALGSLKPKLESIPNGGLMNGNGHAIREAIEDKDEDEVPDITGETQQAHPNMPPTSPLYRSHMPRLQGTNAAGRLLVRRDTTAETTVV